MPENISAKSELLRDCRAFLTSLANHKPETPLYRPGGPLEKWERLSFSAPLAGAPANLVEAVAYPLMPFSPGLILFGRESFRTRLLGNVASLIRWCETASNELERIPSKIKRTREQAPIPVAFQRPEGLWPLFVAEKKTIDKPRAMFHQFADWLKTKHGIALDLQRFKKWHANRLGSEGRSADT